MLTEDLADLMMVYNVVVAKMTHMQGGVMNVIKGLNECYPRTVAGYL
jgi:hypothetical protein